MYKKIIISFLTLALVFVVIAVIVDVLRSVFVEDIGLLSKGNLALMGGIVHAWLSLTAAAIVFGLTYKYMKGGMLALPIKLLGFGALINAIIGFIPVVVRFTNGGLPSEVELQLLWFGVLFLNTSVILSSFWIAKIFGVLTIPEK